MNEGERDENRKWNTRHIKSLTWERDGCSGKPWWQVSPINLGIKLRKYSMKEEENKS